MNNRIASRRFSIIVAEQPTEALPTDDLACLAPNCLRWLNQLIAKTLMTSLQDRETLARVTLDAADALASSR